MCVTSLPCGPRADLWPFYRFLCKRFFLRNNDDVRRCSYFELGLPVVSRTSFHAGETSGGVAKMSASVLNSGAHSFRRLGSQKLPCFFNFPVSRARPEKLCDFYWLQLQITCKSGWIAQGDTVTYSI